MRPDLNFIALDFETANWYRRSACSIGMVKVEQGMVVDEYYSLIKPTPNWFHPINSGIHGLKDGHCQDAPTFGELWPAIKDWIEDRVIVAHNVSFERSVLNHLFEAYQIGAQASEFLCSLYLSRVAFPNLGSYKLPDVYSNALNKALDGHHHALEDARASAEIVIEVARQWNPPTFKGMIGALYEEPVNSRTNPKREVSLAALTPDEGFEGNERFKGKVFVFTGEQGSFTKEEAAQFIVNHGGKANDNVTRATTTVVIGRYNPRFGQDYKSNKVKKAEELIQQGQKIVLMGEEEFLELTKA
jgi:DNA polymerase-3 subunit epsilon